MRMEGLKENNIILLIIKYEPRLFSFEGLCYQIFKFQSFVNVVKYKLDHIRKKLEMEERDQTSRASFKCEICQRSYTDLEVYCLFKMIE